MKQKKKRIEKNGGKVYYANKIVVNGVEVILKEEQFGKGFTFPYRLYPSGLGVSLLFIIIQVARTFGDYYSKIKSLGRIEGTNVALPCINYFNIDEKSDFIVLGSKFF